MLRVLLKLMAGAIVSLSMAAGTAHALTLQQIGGGFEKPIYVTSDPGNPERLFVVERGGAVMLVQNGTVKPFATVPSSALSTAGEGGLLSIALSPDFDSSGRFFLDYTGTEEPGEIHVAEMVASGNSAPSSTLHDVMPPILHPEDSNHYAGQLQFGPEGALFISTGDGGGEDDEHHNSQNPNSELGKLLRLPAPGAPKQPEIWSLGLRNPFRFSFDRLTGDLWIGDVGQRKREEVDFAAAPALGKGANYGWNCLEGSLPGPATDPCATPPTGGYVKPVFEYPHEDPGGGRAFGCAIIGGYVARDASLGELYGRYVYGDLCEGQIRSFCPVSPATTDRSEGLHVENLNSFGQDSLGRLYAISGDGPVYRLAGTGGATCPSTAPNYAPAPPKAHLPSFISIRAVSRKVRRHRRGLVSVWVTPCNGHRGAAVTLWRGRRNMGTRSLDRACSARFRPRIDRRSTFRATVRENADYLPAVSRKLTIKPVRGHRRHR